METVPQRMKLHMVRKITCLLILMKNPLNNRKHELQIEGAREGLIDIYSFFQLIWKVSHSHIKVQSNN